MDYILKKKNATKSKSKCNDKMIGSDVQLGADNQTCVVTNPVGVSDKANFDSKGEAKHTWAFGKSLGLYAHN